MILLDLAETVAMLCFAGFALALFASTLRCLGRGCHLQQHGTFKSGCG